MNRITDLRTTADVEAMLAASHERPVALLKHSNSCPISARGQRQFNGLDEDGGPPMYRVVVQHAREVSALIEERLGIRHETPQAHVLDGGVSVFVQNHREISTDALRAAAGTITG